MAYRTFVQASAEAGVAVEIYNNTCNVGLGALVEFVNGRLCVTLKLLTLTVYFSIGRTYR